MIREPGATTSGFLMQEEVGPAPEWFSCFPFPEERRLSAGKVSMEPTVMTFLELPGALIVWRSGPLLPAAAVTTMPWSHSSCGSETFSG